MRRMSVVIKINRLAQESETSAATNAQLSSKDKVYCHETFYCAQGTHR